MGRGPRISPSSSYNPVPKEVPEPILIVKNPAGQNIVLKVLLGSDVRVSEARKVLHPPTGTLRLGFSFLPVDIPPYSPFRPEPVGSMGAIGPLPQASGHDKAVVRSLQLHESAVGLDGVSTPPRT